MKSKKIFLKFAIYSIMFSVFSYAQESWTPTSLVNAPIARYSHTAVWIGNRMIIWGGSGNGVYNSGGLFDPISNTWSATSLSSAPSARCSHTAVWTGSKMIVWGGRNYAQTVYNTGGIYDPGSNSWTATSISNAPRARLYHTAVWTGSKMIVWGGDTSTNGLYGMGVTKTGGIYDPLTNSWQPTSTINAPQARFFHKAVWTGEKMIIWGGGNDSGSFNTGGVYDPVSDSWTTVSIFNAPTNRFQHTAIWTGSKMIIFGGSFSLGAPNTVNTGGIYDPQTDTWTSTSTNNAPSPRSSSTSIWTGIRMIVWGGWGSWGGFPEYTNTGGIFNPFSNSWLPTTLTNAPGRRGEHIAVWTGDRMVIWGGNLYDNIFNTGGIYYNPSVIGIEKKGEDIPAEFELLQNYPNPFNPLTIINYELPITNYVKLSVFDILGREIAILVNEKQRAGIYEVTWDATNCASGVYVYRIEAGDYISIKKMVLIK